MAVVAIDEDEHTKLARKPSSPTLVESDDCVNWWAVFALCMGNAAHFYSICSLFSYAGIMSADLGWVEDADSAGFVAGFLASANTLGRFPTAGLWGRFTDTHGNRSALLRSYVSIALGGIAFGLCKNFPAAIIIRTLLLGAGNGWPIVFGPMAHEVGGTKRQGEVTCTVFAFGGLVQLMGPGIAGYTYALVPSYPALVPSGIGTLFALMAIVATLRWLPDRRPGSQTTAASPAGAKPAQCEGSSSACPCRRSGGACEVLLQWPLFPVMMLRASHGFLIFSLWDVFPLWAISDVDLGGLSMQEKELGSMLSMGALVKLICTAFISPRLMACIGPRRAALASCVLTGASIVAVPFTAGFWLPFAVQSLMFCLTDLSGAAAISLTNNVSPAERRGEVNGVFTTVESIAKGLGPMTAASIFAWSIATFDRPGRFAIFALCAALSWAMAAILCALPSSVDSGLAQPACAEEEEDAGADAELDGTADDCKTGGRGYAKVPAAGCATLPVVLGAIDVITSEVPDDVHVSEGA